MTPDQIWAAVDAQRAALCDLLDDLTDDQWRHPSLCGGWTVRDVAAHLTQQQLGVGDLIGTMAHWRGSMDKTLAAAARRRAAALAPAAIVADIRATIGSRRHTLGVTYLETLTDILVHPQDIAVPLGRSLSTPAAAAAVATDRLLTMHWPRPLPATRAVKGFRLAATDLDWSAGSGPRVEAPMAALLMLCAGRVAALPPLTGPGAEALTARVAR